MNTDANCSLGTPIAAASLADQCLICLVGCCRTLNASPWTRGTCWVFTCLKKQEQQNDSLKQHLFKTTRIWHKRLVAWLLLGTLVGCLVCWLAARFCFGSGHTFNFTGSGLRPAIRHIGRRPNPPQSSRRGSGSPSGKEPTFWPKETRPP